MWDGQRLDALSQLVDASLVKQVEIGGRSTFSLLAIMREYAIGRLKERGEADLMRIAHADYYMASCGGSHPTCAAPDSPRRCGCSAWSCRTSARRRGIWSTRTASTKPATSPGSLLVYWWISGFFSEVRLWMLELLDKQQPITKHTRAAATFFTMWGEMWRHPSGEVVSVLGQSERLFAESGDEDAAAMALAARATTRLQFPDLDADKAEAELNEAVAKLRELGDGWAESMAEVGLGFLAVVRGQIEEALAHFARSAQVADEGQNMHTRIVAGNNRTRVLFMLGRRRGCRAGVVPHSRSVGPAPLCRGCGICSRGHERCRGVCAVKDGGRAPSRWPPRPPGRARESSTSRGSRFTKRLWPRSVTGIRRA